MIKEGLYDFYCADNFLKSALPSIYKKNDLNITTNLPCWKSHDAAQIFRLT